MNRIEYFKARIDATLTAMEYMLAKEADPEAFAIIDVRQGPVELRDVKVPGALEIPFNELASRLDEIPKNKTVVVYCWEVSCNMAAAACVILLENGFDAKEMIGGIAAWKFMHFPTEAVK